MRINTNATALNTFNSYTAANNKVAGSVAKLSSGYAINSAADNAAGLAISEKMRAQIRGLDKAASNSQDAISLVQTAEGALSSADEILQRMREISTQASSDTNEDAIDRDALQAEFSQLQDELDDISEDTTFNNQKLLDGSLSTKSTSIGGNTAMSTGGLSASVGNAASGLYSFSVGVVTTTPAVAAESADTLTVGQNTLDKSYVTSAKGSVVNSTTGDATLSASSLFNGDYEITDVSYKDGSFTLSATGGSNGEQVFNATVNMNSLDLTTSNEITAKFTDGKNSFDITYTLSDSAAVNGKDYTSSGIGTQALQLFGDSFVGGSFSIAGGKDSVEEVKEVQANLTGASSVTLKAGDTSVTFDNGVTVNFNELTSTDLDTIGNFNTSDTKATANPTNISSTINVNNSNSDVISGDGKITAVTESSYAVTSGGASTAFATNLTATLQASSSVNQSVDTAVAVENWTVNADKSVSFDFDGKTYTCDSLDDTTVALANDTTADSFDVNFANSDGNVLTLRFADNTTATADHTQYSAVAAAVSANVADVESAAGSAVTEYTVTASVQSPTGGSTTYSATMTATDLANGDTETLNFVYGADPEAEADTAFSIEMTAGAAVTKANLSGGAANISLEGTGATDGLKFTIGKADYAYTDTFGDTASQIEVSVKANSGLNIQVGANSGDELDINIDRADAEYLGVNGLDVSTQEGAAKAIDKVNDAINQVSGQRAYLGAIQNRLDYKISNLETSSQNLTSAESSIRDVDMAKEMTKFTNANILSQAATAMLAQANSLPQNVLSLLG